MTCVLCRRGGAVFCFLLLQSSKIDLFVFSRPLALCSGVVVHWEWQWQSSAGLLCSKHSNFDFFALVVMFLCCFLFDFLVSKIWERKFRITPSANERLLSRL